MFNKCLARIVKVAGVGIAVTFVVASAPFWLPEVGFAMGVGGVILGVAAFGAGELMEKGQDKLADAVFKKYFEKQNTDRELGK